MANGFGCKKLGYRGNNSRVDKILKNGKRHYKLSNAARTQRFQHTIRVYKDGGVVTINFVLINLSDEDRYWKLTNKADRINLDEENSVVKVYVNNKCKKFPIEMW